MGLCVSYSIFFQKVKQINDKGEFINVVRFYQKNTLKFQVIFSKGLGYVATRPAINAVSEKRVLKLINTENFKLV